MMAVEKNDKAPIIITGTAKFNGKANCTTNAIGNDTSWTTRANFIETSDLSRNTKTNVSKNRTNGGNHRNGAEAMSVVI